MHWPAVLNRPTGIPKPQINLPELNRKQKRALYGVATLLSLVFLITAAPWAMQFMKAVEITETPHFNDFTQLAIDVRADPSDIALTEEGDIEFVVDMHTMSNNIHAYTVSIVDGKIVGCQYVSMWAENHVSPYFNPGSRPPVFEDNGGWVTFSDQKGREGTFTQVGSFKAVAFGTDLKMFHGKKLLWKKPNGANMRFAKGGEHLFYAQSANGLKYGVIVNSLTGAEVFKGANVTQPVWVDERTCVFNQGEVLKLFRIGTTTKPVCLAEVPVSLSEG